MDSAKMPSVKTRAELTEKLLGIKREHGWSWKHICGEIGGMSPMLIVVPYSAR
jgi:cyanate lyase